MLFFTSFSTSLSLDVVDLERRYGLITVCFLCSRCVFGDDMVMVTNNIQKVNIERQGKKGWDKEKKRRDGGDQVIVGSSACVWKKRVDLVFAGRAEYRVIAIVRMGLALAVRQPSSPNGLPFGSIGGKWEPVCNRSACSYYF